MKGQDRHTEKLTRSGTSSSDEGCAADEAFAVRALRNEDVLIGGETKQGALEVLFPPRVLGSAGVLIEEKKGGLEVFIPARGLLPSEDRQGSKEAFMVVCFGFMFALAFMGGLSIASYTVDAADTTFVVVVTLPGVILGFFCMLTGMRGCFLEETLKFQNGAFTISTCVLGWKGEMGKGDCSSIVSLSHVELERVEEDEDGRERQCSPVFCCAIDQRGTSHRFGLSLSPQDQKLLLAELAKHLCVPVTKQSGTFTSW